MRAVAERGTGFWSHGASGGHNHAAALPGGPAALGPVNLLPAEVLVTKFARLQNKQVIMCLVIVKLRQAKALQGKNKALA